MGKKPELVAGLIATKGSAAPAADMPTRAAIPPALPMTHGSLADEPAPKAEALEPLNFKVPARFRREFKTYAAAHDMKLNELLQRAFASYRQQQGD